MQRSFVGTWARCRNKHGPPLPHPRLQSQQQAGGQKMLSTAVLGSSRASAASEVVASTEVGSSPARLRFLVRCCYRDLLTQAQKQAGAMVVLTTYLPLVRPCPWHAGWRCAGALCRLLSA